MFSLKKNVYLIENNLYFLKNIRIRSLNKRDLLTSSSNIYYKHVMFNCLAN